MDPLDLSFRAKRGTCFFLASARHQELQSRFPITGTPAGMRDCHNLHGMKQFAINEDVREAMQDETTRATRSARPSAWSRQNQSHATIDFVQEQDRRRSAALRVPVGGGLHFKRGRLVKLNCLLSHFQILNRVACGVPSTAQFLRCRNLVPGHAWRSPLPKPVARLRPARHQGSPEEKTLIRPALPRSAKGPVAAVAKRGRSWAHYSSGQGRFRESSLRPARLLKPWPLVGVKSHTRLNYSHFGRVV